MGIPVESRPNNSLLHGILSLLIPGLGQFIAGARTRALIILVSVLTLVGLSVWTIAQRARFPDMGVALSVYLRLALATGILLLFLLALRRLLTRFIFRDPAAEAFSAYGLGILYFLALIFGGDAITSTAASAEELSQVYVATALYSAAAFAALWAWQVSDAVRVARVKPGENLPSMSLAVLIICLLIFTLGYNITDIELPKAIREYRDLNILLPRIAWPWKAAFAYDQEVVEAVQRIQAPCPEGAVGPPSNEPDPDARWISVTPTCGDLGVRDLTGTFTPGTELTITGSNFTPGQTVHILWKNPIGNPFIPRGVGPTDILIDENGEFITLLNIPDVVVPPSTAAGDQIHQLVVREESVKVFSGRLSEEMKLALVGMLETIMIGLMATFFGIILAFPIAFLAAKNLMASIVSPLDRIVGSIIGLGAGFAVAGILTQQLANMVGGIDDAPIPVFLAALVLFGVLGYAGLQLGGRLFAATIGRLGSSAVRLLSALLLAAMAAFPGYVLGLAFSRGIRSIVLGEEVAAVNETFFAYLGAALLAATVFGFVILQRGTKGISIGLILYTVTRTILNIVRSIEPLIWAVVATIWIGLGPFAGTIALTLHTIASLAKLYSEAIESIDPGPLEAIDATGATRIQTIVYAVVPQILPPFISFTIYRWDINVRMSTIIGFVGGGGIGFILLQWMRLYQYESVGIAVWLITITVATLDYVSSEIRERFV